MSVERGVYRQCVRDSDGRPLIWAVSRLGCRVAEAPVRAGESVLEVAGRLWDLLDRVDPLEEVSRPIQAESDDAAIFELLRDVDCTPPVEEDDDA